MSGGPIPFDVHSPKSGPAKLSSEPDLYCICREPYDQNDTKKMFQCEGQCEKWVHPSCFGETVEAIRHFEVTGRPYVCMFCRPDTDCCKLLNLFNHSSRFYVVDSSKRPILLEDLKSKNPEDSDANKR